MANSKVSQRIERFFRPDRLLSKVHTRLWYYCKASYWIAQEEQFLGITSYWPATNAQGAFEQLKHAMVTAPVLVLPDFTQEFIVEADASQYGIGAVLSQKGRPVAYFSKALSIKHQTLSVYEKEMMAILVAVKRWNSYLLGRHFKIKTNHQSLKFLLDQQTNTPAQQQWVLRMMGYDFEVLYRRVFLILWWTLSLKDLVGSFKLCPSYILICLIKYRPLGLQILNWHSWSLSYSKVLLSLLIFLSTTRS